MTTNLLFMTTTEVMQLLTYMTPEGTIACLKRHHITALRAGRRYLWRRADVERLIAKLDQNAHASP